ncbi:MAG TPA: hypothetical protein VHA52_10050 [Candidatus Babeliaceae bacterium]|nr:hypothetical protein [Candidatus Babeliaceae bacterium]
MKRFRWWLVDEEGNLFGEEDLEEGHCEIALGISSVFGSYKYKLPSRIDCLFGLLDEHEGEEMEELMDLAFWYQAKELIEETHKMAQGLKEANVISFNEYKKGKKRK